MPKPDFRHAFDPAAFAVAQLFGVIVTTVDPMIALRTE
jgi:hypothetical protein